MKKVILLTLIVFVLSISLAGCLPSEEENNKPEYTDDFLFAFEFWINPAQINSLNTYTNEIQKDLINDGKAKIEYIPKREDLIFIFNKIIDSNILDIDRIMTSEKLTKTHTIIEIEPKDHYRILIYIDGKEYEITGDQTANSYKDEDKDAKNFIEFCEFMTDFIIQTEEFKRLPESSGGYD